MIVNTIFWIQNIFKEEYLKIKFKKLWIKIIYKVKINKIKNKKSRNN